jgi:hypothetical protein
MICPIKMKTSLKIKLFSSIILVFAFSNKIDAQQQKGESVITIGSGLSKSGIAYTNHSCLFNAAYDLGVGNNFSLGLIITHQGFTHLFTDVYNINAATKASSTRLNIGVRTLYHVVIPSREDLDLYGGVRWGCSLWKESFDLENRTMTKQHLVPTLQAVGGVRWFLDNHFGVNCELAVGSPYFISLGVHYKI